MRPAGGSVRCTAPIQFDYNGVSGAAVWRAAFIPHTDTGLPCKRRPLQNP